MATDAAMSTTAASSATSDTPGSDASSTTSMGEEVDTKPVISKEDDGSTTSQQVFAIALPIFWLLFSFRLFNAFAVRTFFQPDEYFQALEPAWQLAFGEDSGAWITWEWRNQLRSTLHPYLFAAVYVLADRLSVMLALKMGYGAQLLVAAPKVFQAALAATGDYYTWKLGGLAYGENSLEAWAVLALTILNPFHFFVITRTLSNCLELVLTTVALFLWFTSAPEVPSVTDGSRSSSLAPRSASGTPKEASGSTPPSSPLAQSWITLEQSTERIKAFVKTQARLYDLNRLRICLLLAATACVLRVTNLLTWIILASFEFVDYQTEWRPLRVTKNAVIHLPRVRGHLRSLSAPHWTLLREILACGMAVLLGAALLDRSYYHKWSFPPAQFLYFNIAEGVSNFYGVNDASWYFTQGMPLLMGTFIVFLVGPVRKHFLQPPEDPDDFTAIMLYEFTALVTTVPFVFSFVAHKEVRFIYPLLPVLHILAAGPATDYFRPVLSRAPLSLRSKGTTTRYFSFAAIIFVNVLAATVITQYHQCAPLSVLDFLRREHESLYMSQPPQATGLGAADTTMTVGFLMPCHSTPWRSHLVYSDIKAWALGCEPPIGLSRAQKALYRDEADRFYDDPDKFLRRELGPPPKATGDGGFRRGFGLHGEREADNAWDGRGGRKPWPEYLVFFAEKEELLAKTLRRTDYVQCWRGWNSWFHDDWRRRGDIVVLCHRRKPLTLD